MTLSRRSLLVVGSPKVEGSTSETLGACLLERLAERGFDTETISIRRDLDSGGAGIDTLYSASDRADMVVISTPVYVGCLPAPVIKVLELLAEHRRGFTRRAGQALAGIANCGFPEMIHTEVALATCRLFARDAGFTWMGGLALAGGAAADPRRAADSGSMPRNVGRALAMAGDALARNEPIPAEACGLMAKPGLPSWLYRVIGNLSWRCRAHREGTAAKLRDRPYRV